jgi:hypothetical protein
MWISSPPAPGRRWRLATVLTGFAVWAAATVVIRAFGDALFTDLFWIRILLFGGGAIGVFAIVGAVSNILRAPAVAVAIWLVLPGMFLDAGVLLFWEQLFPALTGAERPFGALMLWVYAWALAAGLTVGHGEG